MQLGLMRVSNGSQQPIGLRDLQETLIQADRLRLRQIHLSDLGPEVLATLPKLDQLRIGLDLTAFHPQAPSALVGAIRIAQDQTDGRLVLGLPMGGAGDRCTASQTYETLLSDTEARPLASDLPISAPRPDVLAIPAACATPDVRRAAARGFHALSPSWLPVSDIARHWPAIVAGATHAARRACPSQWHVARCIFVSDDRAAVDAYINGPAKAYLTRISPRGTLPAEALKNTVIAGPAEEVAQRLAQLRARVGPFGTLHCIDPGVDTGLARQSLDRLASDVLPAMSHTPLDLAKELERT